MPFLILLLLLPLTGCMNVASSGAQAVYNHHSLEKSFSDQYITLQAYQKINTKYPAFAHTNITVSTYHGEVLLAGQAPESWQRTRAENIVKQIPNVVRVYNQIQIASPSSSLVRMSDAWITTKVKSQLIASADLDATQVKVVTENGIVYLMGILTPEESVAAVDVASNTKGVLGVVKIFSYMHITKSAIA